MKNPFIRTEALIGKEKLDRIKNSSVAVFGIGGVGSYAAEALVRSGLGKIILVDYDIIDESNINRQIHALSSTIGFSKVQVMEKRLKDINPNLEIKSYMEKYDENSKDFLLDSSYDYIVDAIDDTSGKIDLIFSSKEMGIPIISSMGAGNKLSPTLLKLGDIYETKVCPLAKIMRKELRKKGIESLKVVWSDEEPIILKEKRENHPSYLSSISFVPSVAGLIIASEVIKDIIY